MNEPKNTMQAHAAMVRAGLVDMSTSAIKMEDGVYMLIIHGVSSVVDNFPNAMIGVSLLVYWGKISGWTMYSYPDPKKELPAASPGSAGWTQVLASELTAQLLDRIADFIDNRSRELERLITSVQDGQNQNISMVQSIRQERARMLASETNSIEESE